MARSLRRWAGRLAAALTVSTSAFAAAPAHAATYVPIVGDGSTWAQNAITQWQADVATTLSMVVNYAGNGSTAGRQAFAAGTTDFAVSDVPYGLVDNGTVVDVPPTTTHPFKYLPIVAGATSFMYHLDYNGTRITNLRLDYNGTRITNLRLDQPTIVKIFTGGIEFWDDPEIVAENPGTSLPHRQIVPVVRSDGAGTTYQFTTWMATRFPAQWNAYCQANGRLSTPCGATSFYPASGTMVALTGSTGVSGYVASASGEGAITYVEQSYAQNLAFPSVKMLNASGYYVAPTAGNVAVALTQAAFDPSGLINPAGVYANPDPRSYPLSSVSYAIVPTSTNLPFNAAKGQTLGAFLSYALCTGANHLDLLGYSPLPSPLTLTSLQTIPAIPGASLAGVDTAACTAAGTALVANAPQPSPCDQAGATNCTIRPNNGYFLSTTIQPGVLAITVPVTAVTLPSPVLDAGADLFQTSGQLNTITITDNRAGNPGWTLSGQASDFADAGSHTINGENLGWSPTVVDHAGGQNLTLGPVVAAAAGVLATDVGMRGLKSPQVLASAAPGAGLGTAHLGAGLSLNLPTTTVAGTYTGQLTLTAI